MRMIIDSGNLEAKSLESVKTEVGTNALKGLMSDIVEFYRLDKKTKELKATVSAKKASIVETMSTLDIDKLEHKGIKCTLTERVSKSVDEDGLLEFCKTLNFDGLVKTIEIVDMDVLENLIYNKTIDSDILSPYITETVSTYPKLSGTLKE